MAKVYLRGIKDPLVLSWEEAKKLDTDFSVGTLPRAIRIAGKTISNPMGTIKMIDLEENEGGGLESPDEDKVINWTTEQIKIFLGNYEARISSWVRDFPKLIRHSSLGWCSEGKIKYLEAWGAITDNSIIVYENGCPYDVWIKQEEALEELQTRRAFAAKQEELSHQSLYGTYQQRIA